MKLIPSLRAKSNNWLQNGVHGEATLMDRGNGFDLIVFKNSSLIFKYEFYFLDWQRNWIWQEFEGGLEKGEQKARQNLVLHFGYYLFGVYWEFCPTKCFLQLLKKEENASHSIRFNRKKQNATLVSICGTFAFPINWKGYAVHAIGGNAYHINSIEKIALWGSYC